MQAEYWQGTQHTAAGLPDLWVVRDEEREAASGCDQVLQGGMSNGHAVMRGSAPAQLINDDQGPVCRLGQDKAGF